MFAFANPWLLWLFPALALPWIFRRRRQEQIQHVDFPLLQFLKESEEKEFINPQLQEFLLLLLRTLLLALILLALAGPRWSAPPGLSAAAAWLPFSSALHKHIVVIDSSYSMGYREGERDWWTRAGSAWERVGAGVSGMGAQTVRWDRRSVNPDQAHALLFLSNLQAVELLDSPPREPGASFSDLMDALTPRIDGDERLVIITDGQRRPWESLLGATPSSLRTPPTLVITVGEALVWNAWVELDFVSSVPWGLAEWETIGGRIGMLGEPPVDEGILSIMNDRTGERLYSSPIRYTAALEEPGFIPFSFTASYPEYRSTDEDRDDALDLTFTVTLEPDDSLAFDNHFQMNIPLASEFRVGVVSSDDVESMNWQVLHSILRLWAEESQSQALQLQVFLPYQSLIAADVDLLILPPSAASWWTIQHTNDLMEYLRNGGEAIVFTGGDDITAGWSAMLQSLDWTWRGEPTVERGEINLIGSGPLVNALSLWDETFWDVWAPNRHGRIDSTHSTPLAAYSVGEDSASLIDAAPVGVGRVWIVNAPMTVESGVLLSPLFPVMLWEFAKDAARRGEGIAPLSIEARQESDLTLLSEEDQLILTERHDIRFVQYDELNERTLAGDGALDLRLALLAACLMLALFESWLANRLASL